MKLPALELLIHLLLPLALASPVLGSELPKITAAVGEFNLTQKTLQDKDRQPLAGPTALQAMTQYKEGHDQEILRIADLALETDPLARELPEILRLAVISATKLRRTKTLLRYLEKLALLLPKDSLWRAHQANDLERIRQMETLAKEATQLAGRMSYDFGLYTGDSKYFGAAVTYFTIFLQAEPMEKETILWRIRRANSNYFAGNLAEADDEYRALQGENTFDSKALQLVMYQHVLILEKKWRKTFEENLRTGRDPKQDTKGLCELGKLETASNAYMQSFPEQVDGIDLLLALANAKHDYLRGQRHFGKDYCGV